MKFKVILEPEEEGGYSVRCPALKGCHSQGETVEEVLANIKEAIEGYLLVLNEKIRVDSKKARVSDSFSSSNKGLRQHSI